MKDPRQMGNLEPGFQYEWETNWLCGGDPWHPFRKSSQSRTFIGLSLNARVARGKPFLTKRLRIFPKTAEQLRSTEAESSGLMKHAFS